MSENEAKGAVKPFPVKMTQQAYAKLQRELSVNVYQCRARIAAENATIAQLPRPE